VERVNLITRKGKFDAAHRVLHERFKCYNLHGHEYHYELTFSWSEATGLGQAVDFKEIKRVACGWVDERLDHGFIANPKDVQFIALCRQLQLKVYEMGAVDEAGFCNPTTENIAREIYFAGMVLMGGGDFKIHSVKLWETVNCFVECAKLSQAELQQLYASPLYADLMAWREELGVIEYDDRKLALPARERFTASDALIR
jgi:6-pyruvoyltetrahydropterin/6-carboxytetrahydropterin synthase